MTDIKEMMQMQKRHFEMETVTAASYFEDLTLTIGLTPSDFIWQGFMQGKTSLNRSQKNMRFR